MNIVWLSVKEGTPGRGYWDQRLLEEMFADEPKSNHYESTDGLEGAVVVIPGAYQAPYIDKINEELSKLQWCVVIVTSDEENNFPLDELKHPNMRVFANYYNPKYKSNIYWLPIGPANVFAEPLPEKTNNFVFAGQVTHPAREGYVAELRKRNDGVLLETDGFAKGLDPKDYFKLLCSAKVVPSPAGNISPDSFRLYEAIQAGAVPIPPTRSFWEALFEEIPFPVIDSFEQVAGYINDAVDAYPRLNNEVQKWWLHQKMEIRERIYGLAEDLSGEEQMPSRGDITVVIPVSPIKSHPSIEIVDETIRTVRVHLPDANIVVTFDGVREEQEGRRADYEEFKRRFLWECYNNPVYKNVLPIFFANHTHQVGMARVALQYVSTPMILYVEQDTPLTPDLGIEWEHASRMITEGLANVVRFHFESFIPKEHERLMLGDATTTFHDLHTSSKTVGYIKTSQWSQRPHLASTAYYRRILRDHFSDDAKSFIEDKMHSVVQTAVDIDGILGWDQHRIVIYHPEGTIKRSYHLDGRAGEPKWDETQKF